MTLSRFLRDYVYIPFGGNKRNQGRVYLNLFLTFLIGGIWHGAGWNFIIWGSFHGIALIIYNIWKKTKIKLNKFISWFITFNFINITWIFFRAKNIDTAINIIKNMLRLNNFVLP